MEKRFAIINAAVIALVIFSACYALSGEDLQEAAAVMSIEQGLTLDTYSANGWQYEGELDADGQTGVGRFTYADHFVYEGRFMGGLADGEGTVTDAAGNTVYRGSFKAGLFDGQGTYFSAEGWKYVGGFRDGLFDGDGMIVMDGEAISGVWLQGKQVKRDG